MKGIDLELQWVTNGFLSVEKNQYLGRKPKAFWNRLPKDMTKPLEETWNEWVGNNVTADERAGKSPDDTDSDCEVGMMKVYQRMKPEYDFRMNGDGEPIIPENWKTLAPEGRLDTWKHIVRTYIKVQYSRCYFVFESGCYCSFNHKEWRREIH